ncbi:hypothetical protein A2164_03830 [Candidatus Curtissbacteria bacterium RBG_13_35_7]|uniref:NAD-dependent epimerase/dehydratase domain-containing protein n=1 Tax=Candidatus Curtissbacteria bacterium RBG_13_35_7 TaxID=1797705 RepID=A0A1F5G373_9BACT|nr:MAG: hypothetical protein A2164_03830 [Candidatus Curtissbacteria bacterium RBG_13_35_7]
MKQEKLPKNNHALLARFFKDKKVLVCGGAGFVGSNLILKLKELDAKITATYHTRKPQIKDSTIRFIKTDLTKTEDCKKVVKGQDVVFMCAANTSGAAVIEKTPLVHVTPNVIMNTLMMEAAYKASVKKFLFISSNTVYPPFSHPVKEKEAWNGEPFEKYFPVAWMKRFGEKLGEIYTTKIKDPMAVVVVRPANMYGPYDDFNWETSHVIPALIRKVVERHKPVEVWGDGKEIKDLIYVEDAVEGMLLAIAKINKFMPINVSTGEGISVRKIIKKIIEIDKYKNAIVKYDRTKPTMIKKRILDPELAKKVIGFSSHTPLTDGLATTLNWYKNNY